MDRKSFDSPIPQAAPSTDLANAAELFRILSDPTRLRILGILARKPHNVTDLRKRLKVPQPTTSHHLMQLRRFNLVTSCRAGKQMVYSLGPCIRTGSDGCLHLETCVPGTQVELCLRPEVPDPASPVAQALARVWPV